MPSKKSFLAEQSALHFPVSGLTAGVDEAGRGPLAGPVVAAAVILDDLNPIHGLNDSKKLSAKRREALFDEIRARALCFSIAEASVEEIDRLNIFSTSSGIAFVYFLYSLHFGTLRSKKLLLIGRNEGSTVVFPVLGRSHETKSVSGQVVN